MASRKAERSGHYRDARGRQVSVAKRDTPPPPLSIRVDVQVIVHAAEEGGYWAEVPSLPGCYTQAETRAELKRNIRAAIELYLAPAPKRTRRRVTA